MIRTLGLLAALAVTAIFAGDAQAFGKRGKCGSSCGTTQVSSGGCGTSSYGGYATTTYGGTTNLSTPYTPNLSTPYPIPTATQTYGSTITGSPSTTTMSATMQDGTKVNLIQTGTDQFGRPMYMIQPTTATTSPNKPTLPPNK